MTALVIIYTGCTSTGLFEPNTTASNTDRTLWALSAYKYERKFSFKELTIMLSLTAVDENM